jgi:alpha-1,2-glucosyltransferase
MFFLSAVLDKIHLIFKDPKYIGRFTKVFKDNIDLVILDGLFVLFVIFNRFSVVLGDKSNHSLSVHMAQMVHLLFFILILFPTMNLKILRLFGAKFYKFKYLFKFLIIFAIVSLVLFFCSIFSHTHEFILSDNRHYSFYYFKRIYNNTLIRYALVIYTSLIYSLYINDNNLIKNRLIIAWLICSFMVLVPSKLFEFRYLTLPILTFLLIIHENFPFWKDIYYSMVNIWNVIYSIIINMIVIFVFLKMPFYNEWFDETSRFMW